MKFLLNIWLFFTCRHVRFVVGDGAYAMIYPKLGRQNINKVVEKLQSSLNGRAQVFKKDDIPEHLHWKDSKYCPPILVLARPGIFIYILYTYRICSFNVFLPKYILSLIIILKRERTDLFIT